MLAEPEAMQRILASKNEAPPLRLTRLTRISLILH